VSLCSVSYKGSSFFDLLRQDFPHMLPLQHLPHTPPGESWLLEPGPHAEEFVKNYVQRGGQ
jgi:hypothetical protein